MCRSGWFCGLGRVAALGLAALFSIPLASSDRPPSRKTSLEGRMEIQAEMNHPLLACAFPGQRPTAREDERSAQERGLRARMWDQMWD
jgi:hypothetical protein